VESFSVTVKTQKIQTDIVNLESRTHSFLGSERRPSGGIHAQRPDRQCCIILHNSEVAMAHHPKLLARLAQEWFCCTITHAHILPLAHVRYLPTAWDIFFHPPYSPDLAPSDFHLFTHLKQFLGGTHMGRDEEVKKTVKDWFNGLAANF
jgi:hypothetical protein